MPEHPADPLSELLAAVAKPLARWGGPHRAVSLRPPGETIRGRPRPGRYALDVLGALLRDRAAFAASILAGTDPATRPDAAVWMDVGGPADRLIDALWPDVRAAAEAIDPSPFYGRARMLTSVDELRGALDALTADPADGGWMSASVCAVEEEWALDTLRGLRADIVRGAREPDALAALDVLAALFDLAPGVYPSWRDTAPQSHARTAAGALARWAVDVLTAPRGGAFPTICRPVAPDADLFVRELAALRAYRSRTPGVTPAASASVARLGVLQVTAQVCPDALPTAFYAELLAALLADAETDRIDYAPGVRLLMRRLAAELGRRVDALG